MGHERAKSAIRIWDPFPYTLGGRKPGYPPFAKGRAKVLYGDSYIRGVTQPGADSWNEVCRRNFLPAATQESLKIERRISVECSAICQQQLTRDVDYEAKRGPTRRDNFRKPIPMHRVPMQEPYDRDPPVTAIGCDERLTL